MEAPSPSAYLLLDVAGTPCALPGRAVREALPLPRLHAPPAAGGFLTGLLDLGGRPVPVLDLAALLGLRSPVPPGIDAHLVLLADGARALLVDRAVDLVRVAPGALRPAEDGRSLNGCVAAQFAHGERLVHVLAAERLLSADEAARLDDHARRAAARLAAFAAV